MGRIANIIERVRTMASTNVLQENRTFGIMSGWGFQRHHFARLVWYNICDLLTDITEQVDVQTGGGSSSNDTYKAAAFRTFFYANGKYVLQRLFDDGWLPIGWDGLRFWVMDAKEYATPTDGDKTVVKPYANVEVYVMRSDTFRIYGMSDRSICEPWLNFLDNVCNASSTISERLGVVVMASPKSAPSAPTATLLNKEQKKELEEAIRTDYGALSRQSQVMLLPREMAWQVVNLAGLDTRTMEKAKLCITAIADRIKVPANQISLIDSNSSKALANGGELREGDKSKYKSFRRLFERTFMQMAIDLGINITYSIDGEPQDDAVQPQNTAVDPSKE